MRRITVLLLMTMAAALGLASPAQAANAGDLDTSFDGDGRVVFNVFGEVSDRAQAVAIQPDGKTVVAGWWCGFGAQCSTGTFALARFTPNGSLDKAFGSGGRTLVAFPNAAAEAEDVAIQPDGKIVAAGTLGTGDFALARLQSDGDLDPSFSGDGKVVTSFGGSLIGEAVAIQGNGKIVVAGTNWEFDGGDHDADFALARYNTDGSLDSGFDGDGKLTTGLGGQDEAYAVAIQTNIPFDHRTRIVVAGHKSGDIALARYYVNGSLDSGFDGDGKRTTNFGGSDAATGVAIQENGRIVVAGSRAFGGDVDIVLARYATDGDLDASFFSNGRVVTDFGGWVWARGVAIQGNGKIVVAGLHWPGGAGSSSEDFALARYDTDGDLDTTFSADGKQATGFGGQDRAEDVAIQPDGKIVAAGSTWAGGDSDSDFALARYHAIPDGT